jgi:KDO2-lipid IV(A) lauroyltransferase
MDAGKGTLILTGHFANWEQCIIKIANMGKPVHVVSKEIKGVEDGYYSKVFREPHNVYSISKDGSVLRSVFKALKKGETVVMVMDQNSKRTEGCFVDFLGHTCSTFMSPLIVAAKTGASVVIGCAYRNENDLMTQTICFHKPMNFERSESKPEAVQKNSQKVMDVLGKALMKHPEYWIWMHKRWKTRPKEEKKTKFKINYS